jgi:hypothetical protein
MRRENALLRQIAEREFGNGLMLDRPHPLSNIESLLANSVSNPRVPRFELLDPMPYAVRMLLKRQDSRNLALESRTLV